MRQISEGKEWPVPQLPGHEASVGRVGGRCAVGRYRCRLARNLRGAYNVAADIPHTQPVFWLMETARERSIAVRAAGIDVPRDLTDPKRALRQAPGNMTRCAAAATSLPA